MNQRDGLEGWTDIRMEGCHIVVLILFSQKAKFSYLRQKSIFAKSKIFTFSWAFLVKNENDFHSYFRENILVSDCVKPISQCRRRRTCI
jgi:hypothetical protein